VPVNALPSADQAPLEAERVHLDALKPRLDALVRRFETPAFIQDDPISVPHGFSDPEDIATIGLFAAILAWGRRATILAKMAELCERIDYRPAAFVRSYDDARDGSRLEGFKHRTFTSGDARVLTRNLRLLIERYGSLEALFASGLSPTDSDVGPAIQRFSSAVLEAHPETPPRLRKHLARPATGSAAKRLAMYLRWMVRPGPVDFGLWTRIRPSQLILPLDVHSGRQARLWGLLDRRQDDWRSALSLTAACRHLDPSDPCRYDFALFGAGAYGVSLDDG
jgi:uncharacterized protein (TIGR02757 family)